MIIDGIIISLLCSWSTYEYNVSQQYFRPKLNSAAPSKIINPRTDLIDYDTCALSGDNIVLSGTQLKNTKKLYAVCVYGGRETKVGFFAQGKGFRTLYHARSDSIPHFYFYFSLI